MSGSDCACLTQVRWGSSLGRSNILYGGMNSCGKVRGYALSQREKRRDQLIRMSQKPQEQLETLFIAVVELRPGTPSTLAQL